MPQHGAAATMYRSGATGRAADNNDYLAPLSWANVLYRRLIDVEGRHIRHWRHTSLIL